MGAPEGARAQPLWKTAHVYRGDTGGESASSMYLPIEGIRDEGALLLPTGKKPQPEALPFERTLREEVSFSLSLASFSSTSLSSP
jgi:hypothetical protein